MAARDAEAAERAARQHISNLIGRVEAATRSISTDELSDMVHGS
jgi:hypothetical protein